MTTKALTKAKDAPASLSIAAPPALAPLLRQSVSVALMGIEGGRMPASHDPSPGQRKALETRAAVLDRSLSPADANDMRKPIAAMLLPFTIGKQADADAFIRVQGYIVALEGMPLWAVERACAAALRGDVGASRPEYAPMPPVIRRACEDLIYEASKERREIRDVLKAVVYKPAPDPAIAEKFAALAAELGSSLDADRIGEPSELAEALKDGDMDRARKVGAGYMKGVELSDEALTKVIARSER